MCAAQCLEYILKPKGLARDQRWKVATRIKGHISSTPLYTYVITAWVSVKR